MLVLGTSASGGSIPAAPTIGAAADGGTGTTASVSFTPSTYAGKGTITYTATSSPGGLTGSSSGSPITVSGLTTGTAYTFTVIGTTNYGVASAASAASNSVAPASPSAFESIATTTSTGVSTWTFSSIPSTYTHLQLRLYMTVPLGNTHLRMNGITTNSYAYGQSETQGTANAQPGSNNINFIYLNGPTYNIGATTGSAFLVNIYNYANTNMKKYILTQAGYYDGASARSTSFGFGLWDSTSAINSLTITSTGGNAVTGQSLALYGIS
jgi:hypothetical protein